ncbi:hypothetical protein [Roseovarius sp.]|uniref:tetratricopeptide repeat protein n=1 Tax=Roseovarius sp. TaxID=1486281 RepID=UPI002636BC78|nr:hypothetical protein [Roseovarius sp.]
MRKLVLMVAIAISLGASPIFAQSFQDGAAAAQSGNYAEAVKIWKPLADQGDVRAQYNLGVMYDKGRGADQDYARARSWYRKAAE